MALGDAEMNKTLVILLRVTLKWQSKTWPPGSLALPTGAVARPVLTSASLSRGSYIMALISLVGREKKKKNLKKQAWMLTLKLKGNN